MQDFEIHKKKFDSFLDRINENERIGILSHANCVDGMISVIFLVEILKKRFPNISYNIAFIPYKLGILDQYEGIFNREKINKVFILDANVDMNQLEETERFFDKFEVMFIDHHPTNSKLKITDKIIKTPSDDCTSLVMYNLGKEFLIDNYYKELACVAAISEFSFKNENNLKFIQKYYDFNPEDYQDAKIFKKVLKLNSLITYYSNDSFRAYEIILKKDYLEIDKADKEISYDFDRCMRDFEENAQKYLNDKVFIHFLNPKYSIGSRLSTALSVKHTNATIITLSEIQGTNLIKVSGRNNSKDLNYDLGDMIRAGIKGLDNAIGGGHPRAVGGSFMKKDLETFKKNIIEFVRKKLNV